MLSVTVLDFTDEILNLNKMKYYILRNKFNIFKKRGITLNISPTFNCNFNCHYCAVNSEQGVKIKDVVQLTATEWINFIDTFPVKVAEVQISGGEPTLYKDFVQLINGLLDRKYFVFVFTNLSQPHILMQLNKSNRLIINPTFHNNQITKERFIENYMMLKDYFKMYVDEIEIKHLKFSRVKKLLTVYELKNIKGFRIRPNGSVFLDCWSLINM
jgi:organic radical activating enzyme